MITAVLLALAIPAPAVAATSNVAAITVQDPPIKVWLDERDAVERGERIRVQVRAEEDGYLVVLHADPDGRIRMLFPVDPIDDHFIRGGRDYEVRGRGDRPAITVHEASGLGTVYAAYARDPFQFGAFVRQSHWDYTLGGVWQTSEDAEGDLTALVEQMGGGASFDYDLTYYDVYDTVAYTRRHGHRVYGGHYYDPFYCDVFYCSPFYLHGRYRYRPGFHIGIGVGFGFGIGLGHGYYDPYYYDPFYYDPFYYDPFYYGYYRPYYRGYYHPYRTVYVGYPRTYRNRGFTFKSPDRGFVESVRVRRRPSPTARSTTTSSTRRVTPATTPTRTRRTSSTTAATTRRTPSDATRRSAVTTGARTRARTPSDPTATRIRTPVTPRGEVSSPRDAAPRRTIDQESRRGPETVQRAQDERSRRHYTVQIHGSGRSTTPSAKTQAPQGRRPSISQEGDAPSRGSTRAVRPSESSRSRGIRATPRSGARTDRAATSQRSSERRSVARESVRSSRPSARPSRPSARPSRPSARPSRPSARPSRPSARPSRPSARPSRPSARPSRPSAPRSPSRSSRPSSRTPRRR